jgi:hypothetical protein
VRIYVTHCSAKKDNSLRPTGRKVAPDTLYTATPTQRFMNRCKRTRVRWAIFSDKYGLWFPEVGHEWYEKDPGKVTDHEFQVLLADFGSKLVDFDEIFFYRNPGRFHPLYKRLVRETSLRDRIRLISHLSEIV